MTFTYQHRKQIFFLVLLFLFLLGCSFFIVPKLLKKEKKNTPTLVLKTTKEEKQKSDQEEKMTSFFQVDIKGAVQQPGIYSVQEGSRVIDVIRLAGDLTENADTSVINLSKKVFDEMVIIVYTKEEVQNFKQVKEQEDIVQKKCVEGPNSSVSNDACLDEKSDKASSSKVSLNNASKEEFLTLPGIGESKAEAIIKYREEHGGFQAIEEIKEVSGIGESLYNQIKEDLTL